MQTENGKLSFLSDKCRACDYYRDGCDGAERKCSKWTPIGEPRGTVPVGDTKKSAAAESPKAKPAQNRESRKPRKNKAKKEEPPVVDKVLICYEGEELELKGEEPTPASATDGEETKAAKFTRIAGTRVPRVLDEIRKLKNLAAYYERKRGNKARVYTYEWTQGQAAKILGDLREAVNDLEAALCPDTDNREGGLL